MTTVYEIKTNHAWDPPVLIRNRDHSALPMGGIEFNKDGPFFPTSFLLDKGNHQKTHFDVWRSLHGSDYKDWGFLTILPNIEPRLMFNSEVSAKAFEQWWTAYKGRFNNERDVEYETVPRLPKADVPNVSVFNRHAPYGTDPHWQWVIANCKGKVWFQDNFLFFENDADATLFKLSFK